MCWTTLRRGREVARSPEDPTVSVVASSRNEEPHIRLLVKRLSEQFSDLGVSWEILFADDSDDRSPEVIRRLAVEGYPVRMNHRRAAERLGGQPGALVEAFAIAKGDVILALDADPRCPTSLVADLTVPLLSDRADLAIARRYGPGSSATSLDGAWHHLIARASAYVYKALFREVRHVTDPGSVFYAFRRSVIDSVVLKPEHFKVLLEVLVRGRWDRHVEIPFSYTGRMFGAPSLTMRQVSRYATHTLRLWMETRIDPQRHAETPQAREHCRIAAEHIGDDPGEAPVAPLKVLLIASEVPPTRSGVANAVGRVADGLRDRGHAVTVLSAVDAWRGIYGEVRITGLGLRLLLRPRLLRDFDVINLHGPAPTLSDLVLLALWLRRPSRRPRLVYTHHFDLEFVGLGLPALIYNVLHNVLGRSAARQVATTPSYALMLAAGRPAAEPAVVPWAVDPPTVEWAPRRYRGDRPLRILFVGQQRQYKGIGLLIQAVARSSRLELTVVGSGPLLEFHRGMVETLDARNVSIVGNLEEDERDALFAEHDVIALPSVSRLEAFGIVLLEGMRMGCVPVASDLAGVRDVVGSAGVLVPPRRVARLREVLEELADDPRRLERLSELAVERARGLTWERCVGQYERVLDGARRR